MLKLLVGILATWRMAALLCYDDRFEWLRQAVKVDFVDDQGVPITYAGKILSCFWCTSLTVGIQATLILLLLPGESGIWLLTPFALSAGSILLHHWTRINRDVLQEH